MNSFLIRQSLKLPLVTDLVYHSPSTVGTVYLISRVKEKKTGSPGVPSLRLNVWVEGVTTKKFVSVLGHRQGELL